MNYHVRLSERGRANVLDLRRSSACILLSWLTEHLEDCKDPRAWGESLAGGAGRWKYKVGRYRLLAEIGAKTITILAVTDGQEKL